MTVEGAAPAAPAVVTPVAPAAEVTPAAAALTTPVAPVVPIAPVVPQLQPANNYDSSKSTYNYNGLDVEMESSGEMESTLGKLGLSSGDVLKELTSSKDFVLHPSTRATLDQAFGVGMVNTLIDGIKAQFENSHGEITRGKEAEKTAQAVQWKTVLDQVGGQEAWDALDAWASAKDSPLSTEQFEAFNKIMSGTDSYAHKLAINDLMELKDGKKETVLNLIKGDIPAQDSDVLNRNDFLNLYNNVDGKGLYKQNPGKYDAMRRRGKAKGL